VLEDIQLPAKPRFGSPSVGFEWQTNIKVVMKDECPPSKTLVKRWRDDQQVEILRLELDGLELEFVTSPVTTLEELEEQIAAIWKEVELLRQAGVDGYDYFLPEAALSDETGEVVVPEGYRVHVRHYDGTATGTLQATTARPLDRLGELLADYGGRAAASAIATIDDYYGDRPPLPRVAALLYLVRYYVVSLQGGTNDAQGPKVLLPVMSRTDFHSAYLLLDEREREDFRRCAFHGEAATGDLAFLATPLADPGIYKGPAGATYPGPTIGKWYDSIVDGTPSSPALEPVDRDVDGEGPRGKHRDLLSPPPGYPAHRRGRHFTYAMGYFGTAEDGSMMFELRQVEKVPAKGDPEARNYSTVTVFDAMRKFAEEELPPSLSGTTGTSERATKRRRIEEKT
jgi:hypothetical protein